MIQRPLPFALALAVLASSPQVHAQDAPRAASERSILTILAPAPDTRLHLESRAGQVSGLAPLDLPPTFEGKFSVVVEGPHVARTRGTIDIPNRGGPVRLVSEPRGPSLDLLVRSLGPPGVPDIVTGRVERGVVLATAFTGGLFAGTRAHIQYRERLGEFGDYAADRARDERIARNNWARYSAAVWGVSAVDYWLRPRLAIEEAATGRVVVAAPTLSRGAITLRSLIVPGAGQEFANHRGRGALWLTAAVVAGAGIAMADAMVERDQTQADWAEAMIDSVGPSERPEQIRESERKKRDVQSSEDLRRGFRYALIGAWAANVIDAVFVPAGRPSAATQSPRLSTSAAVGADGGVLVATFHF